MGYAGLGVIGAPMAERILAAGYELHVWNRSPAKAAALVAAGAMLAPSAAALAQRVELLCVCVTDDKAIDELVFGDQGIVAGADRGLIVADHSTIHPLATRRIAERARNEAGICWVDAPVSGGPMGARNGTLAVFAGGDAADVERARPVLMSFAGKLTHLGPVGSGQIAKACNQMISFGTCAVMAESLHLAARLGLDVARLPEAIEGGLADSAVLRHYAPQMLGGELVGNSFNALKDLEIALELGRVDHHHDADDQRAGLAAPAGGGTGPHRARHGRPAAPVHTRPAAQGGRRAADRNRHEEAMMKRFEPPLTAVAIGIDRDGRRRAAGRQRGAGGLPGQADHADRPVFAGRPGHDLRQLRQRAPDARSRSAGGGRVQARRQWRPGRGHGGQGARPMATRC